MPLHRSPLLAALLLAGCPSAGDDSAAAPPPVVDTDGDGWSDTEEIAAGSDPYHGTDVPYLGGWVKGACNDTVVPTGTAVGDISEDFALVTQYGDTLHLHDFCDRVVFVAFGAMWDDATGAAMGDLDDVWDAYGPDEVMVIAALGENADRGTPTPEELQAYGQPWDATFPMVADPDFVTMYTYVAGSVGYPYGVLLDVGLRIEAVGIQDPVAAVESLSR